MNYYSCQRPLPFIPWGTILISFGLQVWWCMIEPNINIKQQHTDLNGEWRRCRVFSDIYGAFTGIPYKIRSWEKHIENIC